MQIQEAAAEPQQKTGPLKLNLKPARRRASNESLNKDSSMNGPMNGHNHSLSDASNNSGSMKGDSAGEHVDTKPHG